MNPRRDGAAYAVSRRADRSVAIVDGARLSYVAAGDGSPVIVFLSGAGMDLDSWFRVRPEAARISATFAYDRFGTGRSDPPPGEQSGATIVATLRAALDAAATRPPYILVGHSLGGLYANLFARIHADEVCGVVLVDAAASDDILNGPSPGGLARLINAALGIVARLTRRVPSSELDSVDVTLRQIETAPPFPDIPLVVVTGGQRMPLVPATAFRAHVDSQRELVALSPHGRHVIGRNSGHFPHLQEPQVVIDAIRDVVERCGS